jgi:hypothetical protein
VVTWIVVAVLILAVLVLVAALAAVGGRLHPLGVALRRLSIRAEQAEGLQQRVETTQLLLLRLQEQLEAGIAGDAADPGDDSADRAPWTPRRPAPAAATPSAATPSAATPSAATPNSRRRGRPAVALNAVARRRRG